MRVLQREGLDLHRHGLSNLRCPGVRGILFAEKLKVLLEREDRIEIAQELFKVIPLRAHLDLLGWAECDIFSHS